MSDPSETLLGRRWVVFVPTKSEEEVEVGVIPASAGADAAPSNDQTAKARTVAFLRRHGMDVDDDDARINASNNDAIVNVRVRVLGRERYEVTLGRQSGEVVRVLRVDQ